MRIDPEEYYRKYGGLVLRRCRLLLKDETAAADAMQDTFVQLLRYQGSLQHQAPSSLLYRIATNVCLNQIRAGKGRLMEGDEALAIIAHEEDLESRFSHGSVLSRIFSNEPESTRVMATLLYIDEMTLEEVAREVNLSVSAVRKRLRTLRSRIRLNEVTGKES